LCYDAPWLGFLFGINDLSRFHCTIGRGTKPPFLASLWDSSDFNPDLDGGAWRQFGPTLVPGWQEPPRLFFGGYTGVTGITTFWIDRIRREDGVP